MYSIWCNLSITLLNKQGCGEPRFHHQNAHIVFQLLNVAGVCVLVWNTQKCMLSSYPMPRLLLITASCFVPHIIMIRKKIPIAWTRLKAWGRERARRGRRKYCIVIEMMAGTVCKSHYVCCCGIRLNVIRWGTSANYKYFSLSLHSLSLSLCLSYFLFSSHSLFPLAAFAFNSKIKLEGWYACKHLHAHTLSLSPCLCLTHF